MHQHHAGPDPRQQLGRLAMAEKISSTRRRHPKVEAGQRYGRLVALSFVRHEKGKGPYWLFRCDCGTERIVMEASVKSGNTKSCGCLSLELSSIRGKATATHGRSKTPEHISWLSMIQRCNWKDHPRFSEWGGRGITVCERWRKFENFYADMGDKPSPKHSIDRIDNSKGYFPENCKWSTNKEQARNRRSSVIVEFQGREMCLKEAAELAGVPYTRTWKRYVEYGWTLDQALNAPRGTWQ